MGFFSLLSYILRIAFMLYIAYCKFCNQSSLSYDMKVASGLDSPALLFIRRAMDNVEQWDFNTSDVQITIELSFLIQLNF